MEFPRRVSEYQRKNHIDIYYEYMQLDLFILCLWYQLHDLKEMHILPILYTPFQSFNI